MFALILVSATVALWTTKSGKLTDLLITATKESATFPNLHLSARRAARVDIYPSRRIS